MVAKLEKQVVKCTKIIDKIVTTYFTNRLGAKEIKIINILNAKGKFTFSQKVNLFCDISNMSQIDAAKFKVFTKINNEVILNDSLSNSKHLKDLNNYFPFLINTYLLTEDILTLQQKLTFTINSLIEDVIQLTKIYTEKPGIYHQKK